jgi:hypothetical protein
MQIFSTLLTLLLTATLASAATFQVATNGSDSTSCGSGPRQSIAAGLTCLNPGDTLLVQPGVYAESWGQGGRCGDDTLLCQWPSGTPGNPITVKSATPRGAIIRPANLGGQGFIVRPTAHDLVIDGFVLDGSNQGAGTIFVEIGKGSHDITIQNMEVMQGKEWSQGMGMDYDTWNLRFTGNSIHDMGTNATAEQHFNSYGFYWHTRDSVFEDNEVYNCSGYGMHFYTTSPGTDNNVFRNNRFWNNGMGGMLISGGRNTQVVGNSLCNNGHGAGGDAGIRVGGFGGQSMDGTRVENNTIVQNVGTCLLLAYGATNITVQGNTCAGNTSDSVELSQGATTAQVDANRFGVSLASLGPAICAARAPKPPRPAPTNLRLVRGR